MAFLFAMTTGWAQDDGSAGDITAWYLENADISNETLGWEFTNKNGNNASSRVVEFYAGWSSLSCTEGSMSQTFTNVLPAGDYRLTAYGFFRQGGAYNVNPTKSLATMSVSVGDVSESTTVCTLGSIEGLSSYADNVSGASAAFYTNGYYLNSLDFTLTEAATPTVKLACTFDEMRSWFIVGAVKLYRVDLSDYVDEYEAAKNKLEALDASTLNTAVNNEIAEALTKNVNQTKEELSVATTELNELYTRALAVQTSLVSINALIAECESASTNSTPNAESYKSTFDAAIAEAKSVRDVATTAEEFNAAYNTLETARQTYVVNAVPAEGYPFDLTFKVVNPYFDNGTTGWVSNTGASNNRVENNQTGDITGNFYANWNWSSYVGTIEQTVTNLPNGVYSVTIAAFRDQLIDGASEQDAVYVFGNDQSTLVTATTGTYYTVENVKVFDGTLRLGIESTVANYRWMGIDNASIALTGAISDEEVETLLAAKETLAAAEVLDRVIAKKIGINNILNDAQCAANIEEASALYNDALSDPTSVAAEDINAMIATLWADLDDYTANVLNGEFESDLENWVQVADGQYAYSGICAYGSGSDVNSAVVPTTDIAGQSANSTLGISAAWTGTMSYTQTVALPAGKHILTYDAYESNKGTVATNLTGVTVNGTAITSTLTSYIAGEWNSDVIEFEMAEAGTVTLTVGYKSNNVGSGNTPKLWIDNVKVYSANVHRRENTEPKYGTICLPFNAELPENMLLYSVAGVDSKDAPTTLYLNKETSLQAGVAYIYYSLDTNDIMLQKSDVAELLDAPEASSNGLTGTFVGAIPTTETTFTGEHYYLLSQNKWVKVKNEYAGQVGVKRFRAYLDVQQIADENTGTEVVSYARSMNIGGGANGIEEILNSLNGGDDLFYTVGGQRVSAPVKGLYIKNGKKIIVK